VYITFDFEDFVPLKSAERNENCQSMPTKRLELYRNEKIAILPLRKTPKGQRYAVTNHGRVISFNDTPLDGYFLRQSLLARYPGVTLRRGKKESGYLVHRLVAKAFLKKPTNQHRFVMHLNYKKDDNHFKNLKWATREELSKHHRSNPNRETAIGKFKLTPDKVLLIRQQLSRGKTTLNALAKKFHVSDMQIHRIKTGENWSHVGE
jgi:hypothetical protein